MRAETELSRILLVDEKTNACDGNVYWNPKKSLWVITHFLLAIIGGALTFSVSAGLIFLFISAATLCLGHSLGMHRRLIHNSYECPRWLEYFFVHLGVLVGLAGPLGMMKTHDLRDWAQRQADCHTYLRHGETFWKDAWWQLHCDLNLKHPPEFKPEPRVANDRVLNMMEQTWMLQQLPLAIILFMLGGISWVIWGISVRVAVSVTGHWWIGYFAHNQGEQDVLVSGAAVQGHNVRWSAYLTMGESWHNNHHAFPGSANLGLYDHQADPGWWVLSGLQKLGLVWQVVLPADLPPRENMLAVSERAKEYIDKNNSIASARQATNPLSATQE